MAKWVERIQYPRYHLVHLQKSLCYVFPEHNPSAAPSLFSAVLTLVFLFRMTCGVTSSRPCLPSHVSLTVDFRAPSVVYSVLLAWLCAWGGRRVRMTAEVSSSFTNFLNASEINADLLSGTISSANRDMEKTPVRAIIIEARRLLH